MYISYIYIYIYIYIYHTCTIQDSVKLLLCESLHVADSLDKALEEEIRKIILSQLQKKRKRLNISMEIIERN